jgi:hypothetical protein
MAPGHIPVCSILNGLAAPLMLTGGTGATWGNSPQFPHKPASIILHPVCITVSFIE